MKTSKIAVISASMIAVTSLFSCVNKDYNFDNMDNSFQVGINNLTLPINISPITLKQVLDISDDSEIKVIDGGYAYIKEGDLTSSDVKINNIVITKPNIENIEDVITSIFPDIDFAFPRDVAADEAIVHFDIPNKATVINVSSSKIDNSVQGIDYLKIDEELEITFKIMEENGAALDGLKNFEVENLDIQFLKNISATTTDAKGNAGTYNEKTGIIHFDKFYSDSSANGVVKVRVTKLGHAEPQSTFIPGNKSKGTYSQFKIENAEVKPVSGTFHIYGRNLTNTKAETVTKILRKNKIRYNLQGGFKSDIELLSFTGTINYNVDGFSVAPIKFNNLPEALKQTGTIIDMKNPQIYMSMKNPVDNKIEAITPTANVYLMPYPVKTEEYKVDGLQMKQGTTTYCLSPIKPDKFYTSSNPNYKFTDAEYIPWSNLGSLLAYKDVSEDLQKLPDSIKVDGDFFLNQHVTDFELKNYGKLDGYYSFLAPLELTKDSKITYNDTIDGWNDADIDRMAIKSLGIKADVTSDLGLEGTLIEISPIQINNNKKVVNKNISASTTLPSGKKSSIELILNGDITHLDGIMVKIKAAGVDKQLKPDQKMVFENMKVTVSGAYTKWDN